MLFISTIHIRAQQPDIEIQFNIFLDGKFTETDSVQIGFVANKESIPMCAIINNDFKTFFRPNREYYIVITHPGYNKQILRLKTSENDLKRQGKVKVYLTKGTEICNIGIMRYSELLKSYIVQEY